VFLLVKKLLVVLGSGGHTAEMISLFDGVIRTCADVYMPRIYVSADMDILSEAKVKQLYEKAGVDASEDIFVRVPRSRNVGQSWLSSVFTTLYSFVFCLRITWKYFPTLILCNGPGTCVPVVYSALLLRYVFSLSCPKIVFVESFARVKTLSLSGKLLYPVADLFIVQWKQLAAKYPRAKFADKLV
jgi:beta-1,4-N-acetylglucosaminyltransferase